jgi:hypothetical protein
VGDAVGVAPADDRSRPAAVALSGGLSNLLVDWLMTGTRQSPRLLTEVVYESVLAALTSLRDLA